MKDNGVICPMPFIQFSTTSAGQYQACCIAKPVGGFEHSAYNFENTSPMEFFNSKHMKTLRHDMARGVKSKLFKKTCHNCIEQEKLYGKSKRLDALSHHVHGNLISDIQIETIANSKDVDLEPKEIDHLKMKVFGNVCNLRCITCSPGASSRLAVELKKYGKYKGPTLINSYKTVDKDKLYADLDIICPVIREFEIVGGEPLMMNDALEMIEWMISKGYNKTLEFRIITNATITNMEFFNLMKYFKRATFIVSLDGVGKKDEYIRDGTIWEEKVECIKNMIYAGIDISWSNTIQLLNIGYLDEIYDFVENLRNEFPTKKINPAHMNNLLTYPKKFRATNVPVNIANKYLDNYINKKFDCINTHRNTLQKSIINNEFMSAMKEYKYFDEKRGTCLLDEWPEFENYYSLVGQKI